MDSPFDVLRIDSDADEGEIDRAYRRRVKETHPDHGGSAAEFQLVKTAYEELKSRDSKGEPDGRREQTGKPERTDERKSQGESRVEYLNYEVLDDHGWALNDDALFEKAAGAGLDPTDYGRILVQPDETLLQAAENRGFAWPYACRGGACANCAVAVADGEMNMPVDHILPPEMLERGIRLSCVGSPATEAMKVVYNVKHMPDLDELRLPPRPFEEAYSSD